MKDVLGEDMCELFIQQSEREAGFMEAQVTPVEFDRYLRNF
jgi:glutamine synthetase